MEIRAKLKPVRTSTLRSPIDKDILELSLILLQNDVFVAAFFLFIFTFPPQKTVFTHFSHSFSFKEISIPSSCSSPYLIIDESEM